MKTTSHSFFLIAVISLMLSACGNSTVTTGNGSEKVEGNGKVETQSRTVTAFHAVQINGVFNVQIDQGAQEAVKVETDENIQPMVITEVVNDTLKITLKDDVSISNSKKMNVWVTVVDLNRIEMQGVGSLKSSLLKLKELELDNEGVGATSLNLEVGKLTVNTESVGALTLNGLADDVSIRQDGVGILQAFGLKTNKLSLVTSGVGACEVYAALEISIDASGIGSVKYKGGASKRNIKSEGVGKVSEVE